MATAPIESNSASIVCEPACNPEKLAQAMAVLAPTLLPRIEEKYECGAMDYHDRAEVCVNLSKVENPSEDHLVTTITAKLKMAAKPNGVIGCFGSLRMPAHVQYPTIYKWRAYVTEDGVESLFLEWGKVLNQLWMLPEQDRVAFLKQTFHSQNE